MDIKEPKYFHVEDGWPSGTSHPEAYLFLASDGWYFTDPTDLDFCCGPFPTKEAAIGWKVRKASSFI